ncbi:radial spoke head 1 homolog [Colletes gigas]|uniref:radial spoke head 1 homolog n=1 Tax=Colletes gigas TaxID=935657 RepID=UPI001C9AF9E1|nr:radial spoke head 1 homolog [Colletes gigas]
MKKQGASKALETGRSETKDAKNIKHDKDKFMFNNGDIYDGEYKLNYEQFLLVKQGKGIYTTDNLDVYDAEWDNDTFADSEIRIRYNDDAQYRGKIDSYGTINGHGTYTFPDGSTIQADWLQNKPYTNVVYREPFGYTWIIENMSENSISFSSGNHFWTDMLSDQSAAHSLHQNEPYRLNESDDGA